LASLDQCNAIRRNTAMKYNQKLWERIVYVERGDEDIKDVYLRCVYLCKIWERESLVQDLKAKKIYPWDWYQQVVAPKWVGFDKISYSVWSCPIAEKMAQQTINIPNHAGISPMWAQRVITSLMM
jgi:dTDP-4-amino-4,6-dideoxygalactose transaminase